MNWDSFFTDGDKPYSENLNDSLMLCDAFDVTVPAEMPTMFNNGEFNSTVNVTRKCGVALVTLKSVGSGVTVGTSSISGTGDVVFRVYPNFNSFYKWSKIILGKSGTVSIAFRKTDGTSISATVGADGTISDNSALKQLQEIDVVLTLSNATISSILIEFVNNHTAGRTRTGALLEASQLVNVDGTVAIGDGKAVSGDTVKTAFDSFESDVVDEKLEDLSDLKEDLANKVTSLDSSDVHYPSSKAVKTVTDALNSNKENVSNKVTSLDSNDTHYPSSKAVKTVTDAKEDSSNKVTTLDSSSSHYPSCSAVNAALTELINKIYPVGAIYMSLADINPATQLGVGVWQPILGEFLIGASNTYPVGTHGGSANTALVAHNHITLSDGNTFMTTSGNIAVNGDERAWPAKQSGSGLHLVYSDSATTIDEDVRTADRGGDGLGKNIPPYLAVYMWKRTG